MLDFAALARKEKTMAELVEGLDAADLAALTNEMVDTVLELIAGCTDDAVTFTPVDPEADDPYAGSAAEVEMPWTLGHVIVHATASSEESAVLAAELARGVAYHGRSRYETPWEGVTTVAQCRARLEESRRMRLASLQMWPAAPHLQNRYIPWPGAPEVNCVGRFVLGLWHEYGHLEQIEECLRQAQAAQTVCA